MESYGFLMIPNDRNSIGFLCFPGSAPNRPALTAVPYGRRSPFFNGFSEAFGSRGLRHAMSRHGTPVSACRVLLQEHPAGKKTITCRVRNFIIPARGGSPSSYPRNYLTVPAPAWARAGGMGRGGGGPPPPGGKKKKKPGGVKKKKKK